MRVIKMSRLSVESLAPVLFLVCSFRKTDMGLAGGLALFQRIHGLSSAFSLGHARLDKIYLVPFSDSLTGSDEGETVTTSRRDDDRVRRVSRKVVAQPST